MTSHVNKLLNVSLSLSIFQVSSPLTQLTLHPSPQHPSSASSLSQCFSAVKEEGQSSCSLSKASVGAKPDPQPTVAMETTSMDKDQMLQEKDKQIEELTRMLRQKQRLVETLRSQLEQGKTGGCTAVKKEDENKTTCSQVKHQTLIKASAIQPPTLPNGIVLRVKKEEEPDENMEGVTEEAQTKKAPQPMQCSQETLLRLQQIHRLQVQQAEQHKLQPAPVQKTTELKPIPQKPAAQKRDAQILLRQQQQLQQLIIQQTQQKQLQAQNKLAQQNQLRRVPAQAQQKNQVQLKQVQVQIQNQTAGCPKPAVNQSQQRKQQKLQQRQKQQTAPVTTQQVKDPHT